MAGLPLLLISRYDFDMLLIQRWLFHATTYWLLLGLLHHYRYPLCVTLSSLFSGGSRTHRASVGPLAGPTWVIALSTCLVSLLDSTLTTFFVGELLVIQSMVSNGATNYRGFSYGTFVAALVEHNWNSCP